MFYDHSKPYKEAVIRVYKEEDGSDRISIEARGFSPEDLMRTMLGNNPKEILSSTKRVRLLPAEDQQQENYPITTPSQIIDQDANDRFYPDYEEEPSSSLPRVTRPPEYYPEPRMGRLVSLDDLPEFCPSKSSSLPRVIRSPEYYPEPRMGRLVSLDDLPEFCPSKNHFLKK